MDLKPSWGANDRKDVFEMILPGAGWRLLFALQGLSEKGSAASCDGTTADHCL